MGLKVLTIRLQNHSKWSISLWMCLELLEAYPNLLCAHSKYDWSCFFTPWWPDKIEQLPLYFECALSSSWHIFECAYSNTWHLYDVVMQGIEQRIHTDVALWVFWMRIERIWICIEHLLSVFKIKIIIWLILEPKHKNFKDQYNIKGQVKQYFQYQARHVFTSGFWMTLLSGNPILVT